jgi:lipooligosaccharide transport system permease protein
MATPAALRATEHFLLVYRRTWRSSVFTTVIGPALFLGVLGGGLGTYIDPGEVGGVDYLTFLAPGLLAGTLMQTGAMESTWPIVAATHWQRTYFAMTATPLRVRDVMLGHVAFLCLRLAQVAVAFGLVAAAFGAVERPGGFALALAAAVLVGLAFLAPLIAYTVTLDNERPFAPINRFVIQPLFLFSGTFFPVSQLPDWLEPLAWATPLWHGVELCRGLALGTLSVTAGLGHTAVLVAMVVVGLAVADRTYARRLAP